MFAMTGGGFDHGEYGKGHWFISNFSVKELASLNVAVINMKFL